jgi:hypothetical protein
VLALLGSELGSREVAELLRKAQQEKARVLMTWVKAGEAASIVGPHPACRCRVMSRSSKPGYCPISTVPTASGSPNGSSDPSPLRAYIPANNVYPPGGRPAGRASS